MFMKAQAWNTKLYDLLRIPFSADILQDFGALTSAPAQGREAWRLVTGAFIHLNLIHLIFNCYCVFSLGRAVESYYGARRMFISFVACSIVANLSVVQICATQAFYIGTLGGLFGLDGVILGFAIRNRPVIPRRSFYWMLGSALFWPVFWVVLTLSVFEGRGGLPGLLGGFTAGTVLGLAFRSRLFKPRQSTSKTVTVLFLAALTVCILSWGSLLSASRKSDDVAPITPRSPEELQLHKHASKEGGFEVLVPDGMTVDSREGDQEKSVNIGRGDWIFCNIDWRKAGVYDELESLSKTTISDRRLETSRSGEPREVNLVEHKRTRIASEEAVFFVLLVRERAGEMLLAQGLLIHDEKIYRITFCYPTGNRRLQEQVDAVIKSFRFTDFLEKQ
jgi:membrane associated rhomboid family serine protease